MEKHDDDDKAWRADVFTLSMSPLWMSCTSMTFSEMASLCSSSITRVASVACRDISLARASEVFPCDEEKYDNHYIGKIMELITQFSLLDMNFQFLMLKIYINTTDKDRIVVNDLQIGSSINNEKLDESW